MVPSNTNPAKKVFEAGNDFFAILPLDIPFDVVMLAFENALYLQNRPGHIAPINQVYRGRYVCHHFPRKMGDLYQTMESDFEAATILLVK